MPRPPLISKFIFGGKATQLECSRWKMTTSVNILTKLLKRQCQSAEEWGRSDLLNYYEEVTVARMDEQEDVSLTIKTSFPAAIPLLFCRYASALYSEEVAPSKPSQFLVMGEE